MKKMSFVFACVAVLAMVGIASAQTHLSVFFATNESFPATPPNTCPNTAGFNPTPGNPTIRLAPGTDSVQSHFADTAALLYMDVNCRGDGISNEIVSSMGLNVHKVAGTGTTPLTANSFTVFTSGTGAVSGPWSSPSPNTPTLNAAGNLLVQNSRAVAVPSSVSDA